jgi:hypothetical protein
MSFRKSDVSMYVILVRQTRRRGRVVIIRDPNLRAPGFNSRPGNRLA